jgi:hypothetical protein
MEERFLVTGATGCIGAWVVRNRPALSIMTPRVHAQHVHRAVSGNETAGVGGPRLRRPPVCGRCALEGAATAGPPGNLPGDSLVAPALRRVYDREPE